MLPRRNRRAASGGTTVGRIRRRAASSFAGEWSGDLRRVSVHGPGGGVRLHRRLGGRLWLNWEPLFTALGVLLLAQVVVDALWARR
jgi:hypothetical protein